MSLDRRLRDGFERSALVVDPDLRERLSDAGARYRRRRRVRRIGAASGIAAAIALTVLVGPRVLDGLRSLSGGTPARPPEPSPTAAPFNAIAGTFTLTLPESPGVVRENGMAGSWTLRLRPDGTMFLSAPTSFAGSTSAISFVLAGSQFRTAAFANDLCATQPAGRYVWQRTPDELVFTLVDDPCPARVTLFTSRPWRPSG